MPIWCPPTPPAGDGDVYAEPWARALYRRGAAPDALLPAVCRREPRREPRRARPAPRQPGAPPSLFERAGPRARPRPRPAPPAPHAAPDWAGAEDAALRRALRLQRLPPEPPAAHAPNWDWAADLVADAARAYRSPRACRERHDALADPERARRRHRRPPAARRRQDDEPRPPLARLDALREAAERRRQAPARRHDEPHPPNARHAALLAEHGVDYDAPPTPMEVAVRRAERIAKEKLKAAPAAPAPHAAPPQRIVVAAAPAPGKAEPPRRARPAPDAARPAAGPAGAAGGAALLYRQQAFPARHLKILHQAAAPHAQGAADGAPALRKLQLQQLALRRAAPAAPAPAPAPAPPAPGHVVVAHLQPPHAPRAPDARQ